MSRGWESKNVENQQSLREQTAQEMATEAENTAETTRRSGVVELRANIAADAEMKRQRQALELQRERILSERTSSPHRRTALEAALLEIEEKLGELGWTLHL